MTEASSAARARTGRRRRLWFTVARFLAETGSPPPGAGDSVEPTAVSYTGLGPGSGSAGFCGHPPTLPLSASHAVVGRVYTAAAGLTFSHCRGNYRRHGRWQRPSASSARTTSCPASWCCSHSLVVRRVALPDVSQTGRWGRPSHGCTSARAWTRALHLRSRSCSLNASAPAEWTWTRTTVRFDLLAAAASCERPASGTRFASWGASARRRSPGHGRCQPHWLSSRAGALAAGRGSGRVRPAQDVAARDQAAASGREPPHTLPGIRAPERGQPGPLVVVQDRPAVHVATPAAEPPFPRWSCRQVLDAGVGQCLREPSVTATVLPQAVHDLGDSPGARPPPNGSCAGSSRPPCGRCRATGWVVTAVMHASWCAA